MSSPSSLSSPSPSPSPSPSSSLIYPIYSSLTLSSPAPYVLLVLISSNPMNTMTIAFWKEMRECMEWLGNNTDHIRCVILTGGETIFSSGLDLKQHLPLFSSSSSSSSTTDSDSARVAYHLSNLILSMQHSCTVLEQCPVPIISLISGPAIGGAVDFLCSTDIRCGVNNSLTYMSVKEIDIGMVADVGTLQRMGKLVGNQSKVFEICYTGRKVGMGEAKEMGFLSQVKDNYEEGMRWSIDLAKNISSKSPLAIMGIKRMLLYSRDHSVRESLDHMATYNSVGLQTKDIVQAIEASKKKQMPIFAKL